MTDQLANAKLRLDRPVEAVARLTISRPEARNALDHDVLGAIAEAMPALDHGIETRCVILSGEALFAALAGAVLLSEFLTPIGWTGCALILAAILLVELGPLLERWGVRFDPKQAVGDLDLGLTVSMQPGQAPSRHIGILGLGPA